MGTYKYTGAPQFVTVSTTGKYDIVAFGASGGAAAGPNGDSRLTGIGGYGAEVGGYVQLTAGEQLEIIVGGAGQIQVGGGAGGGGGGSFVLAKVGGTYSPILVAGGGGGARGTTNGGAGVLAPGSGQGGAVGTDRFTGAGGAGVKSNGASASSGDPKGGSNGSGNYAGGSDTGSKSGGFGGGGGGDNSGGGGGGYSGGNGGYANNSQVSSGSGGGSYDSGIPISSQTQAGENPGNGRVIITPNAVCFAAETLIRTWRDGVVVEVAVEHLRVGDLAVTASGAHRPVRWLGHRKMNCRAHPRPHECMPVRIAAHAFGEALPARDLRVSPGHSLCVDVVGEVLIPAVALLNGSTIVQEDVDHVTYWHVELDAHEIILAENLPCESYLEMSNRGFFAESGTEATALHGVPDAPVVTHADFCRPFHADGPLVDVVRAQLAARAARMGWTLVETPLGGLHLVVDGRRVEPVLRDLTARFLVPADAAIVWLVSDTAVPAHVSDSPDPRALGVCLGRIVIDDGFDLNVVGIDDPRLDSGFHEPEGSHLWTTGRARLPSELWAHCCEAFFLRIELAAPALPRWVTPRRDDRRTFARAGRLTSATRPPRFSRRLLSQADDG